MVQPEHVIACGCSRISCDDCNLSNQSANGRHYEEDYDCTYGTSCGGGYMHDYCDCTV